MFRRLCALGFAAAILTAATGCVEKTAKADPSTDDKAKGNTPPTGSLDPAKKAGDFSAFSTTDPLVAAAVETRDQVVEQEDDFFRRLDDLRGLLAAPRPDPDSVRQSAAELVRVTKDLRVLTRQASDTLAALGESSQQLARSLKHLGASYRAAADLYRRKARDYGEPRLRNQLLAFADDLEAVAKSVPDRQAALREFQAKLPPLRAKAKEAAQFLDDAAQFLATHPATGPDQRARYAGEFESFAVTFSEWLRTLDEVRTKLRGQAISQAVRDAHQKEVDAKAAETDRRAALVTEIAEQVAKPDRSSNSAATDPASPPVREPVPATPVVPGPTVVATVPTVVTRCVLVPVTCYHTQPDRFGRCVTVATTRYQWRTQLVSEPGVTLACR